MHHITLSLGLIALLAGAGWTQGPSDEEIRAVISQKPISGEPYALKGNRLYFTNYYFIRPGNLIYRDKEGRVINARRDVPDGPWDVQAERPSSPYGIRIRTYPAERGPLFEPEYPWEENELKVRTILKDGGKLRAWGASGHPAYFESTDGIHWDRPKLGIHDLEDGTETNLLESGPVGCVFIDPSAPPEQRYKSVGGGSISWEEFVQFTKERPDAWESRAPIASRKPPEARNVQGGYSADGLAWTRYPRSLSVEYSDGVETGMYHEDLRKYLIFTRTWFVGPRAVTFGGDVLQRTWFGEHHGSGRRAIGWSMSNDFANFPVSEPLIVPVPNEVRPSEVFYTSIYTTMPGAPDHHLMIPSIWDTRDDTCSIGVWSSYNALEWDMVPGPRLLETAPFGDWDGGCLFAYPNLFERGDGSFAMAYEGYNLPHKYPRATMKYHTAFMIWPKGRMIAIEAEEIGEFATVGLIPPGKSLKLNALTQRLGGIRVELATLNDEIIPGHSFDDCDPVQGDQFWKTVTWNGSTDFGVVPDQGIVFRFKLDRAKLFGLEFE